jgi:hypothetical protein
MNSNQRSQGNNQTSNGGNEKAESSSRGDFVEKDSPMRQDQQSQQSESPGGSRQGGLDSTERTGSQTGSEQQGIPGQHQSNDVAGGLPKSPGGKRLSADQNMDDDTGLSNRGNRQSAEEIDEGTRQEQQSNVGRRSDMTPD